MLQEIMNHDFSRAEAHAIARAARTLGVHWLALYDLALSACYGGDTVSAGDLVDAYRWAHMGEAA